MSEKRRFTRAAKAMLEHDHLPGIEMPLSQADLEELAFQVRRDDLIKSLKDLCGTRCWSCGSNRSMFVCENRNLKTLRRRCLRCLRQDRAEAAIAAEAASQRREREEAAERFKQDLAALRAMPAWDRNLLLDPLSQARVSGVPIPVDSPLWNTLAVQLLRKARERRPSLAA